MRRLSQKRLLRLASLILTGLTVVFGILWVVRGLRPANACGLLDAVGRLDWAAALACVDQADYEALLFGIALAASFVAWMASRNAPDKPIGEFHPTPSEQIRNRKGMIDRVWAIWIEGHLDQTLYQAVLMSLGMTLRPAAPRPGSVRLRRAGEAERPVPEHVSTVQLFDEAGHMLLILGEPGSGKSTMMLDLARSLLERARTDESTPIPVVFNLSSLTDSEQSLDDWLVGEFRSNYQVPEKVARYWLAHDELALLLDGLDEVSADRRAGVVEKIDRYRAQHMDPWLVICCRQNEYAELVANEAAVEGVDAIVLQPLTEVQIESYLADLAGPEPQRLWRALQDDDVLMELADTPLMLNVMLLAAEKLDWTALPSDQGRGAMRADIYDAYIRSTLARPRNTGKGHSDDQTVKWLHWLAGKMVDHGHPVFLLESMKRSWLEHPWQHVFWVLVTGLIVGVSCALLFGLPAGLLGDLIDGLSGMLILGMLLGFLVGMEDIDVQEQVRLHPNRSRLRAGLIVGLIIGFGGGLYAGWRAGLILGLMSGLIIALWFGLFVQSTAFESTYLTRRPNAAIHQSLRSGLIAGLTAGLIFGLILGLVFGLVGLSISDPILDPVFGLSAALIAGLGVGLFGVLAVGLGVGLFFGFATVIKHYTLRLVLFLDGSMPLNYVRFLDYCVDRVLLRRVGGGYMFIHRTMMEHIASLDLEEWKEQPDSP